jgi:hypothetical protein
VTIHCTSGFHIGLPVIILFLKQPPPRIRGGCLFEGAKHPRQTAGKPRPAERCAHLPEKRRKTV